MTHGTQARARQPPANRVGWKGQRPSPEYRFAPTSATLRGGGGILGSVQVGVLHEHWAALTVAATAVLTLALAVLAWLARGIKAGREEQRGRVATLATLVADWVDQIEDHLDDQDLELHGQEWRLARLEEAKGLPWQPPVRPVKPRKRSRRVDIVARGLDGSVALPSPPGDALGAP